MLFIGHADRLDWAGAEPKFTPVGDPGCFAYQRKARGSAGVVVSVDQARPQLAAAAADVELDRFEQCRRDDSARVVDDMPLRVDQPLSLLDQAAELANIGRFDEAIAACERHLQQKSPSASAYYLMGMIRQAAGDRPRAEDCFKKAVYLDPRHDEALLALALLAERRGDHVAAAGFRRRAERIATTTAERGELR